MKRSLFCVMVSLSINAGAVIDGTVWERDHGIFPITNAIALVNRKMRARHVDKVIYTGVTSHKVNGRHYWSGIALINTGHDDYKAQLFTAYRSGNVEIHENNDNYSHDPKSRYPSYSIDRVLEQYRRIGGDINYITSVGCDENPTNAVWVIRALDKWVIIDERSPSAAQRIPSITHTTSTAVRSR